MNKFEEHQTCIMTTAMDTNMTIMTTMPKWNKNNSKTKMNRMNKSKSKFSISL